ncbi:IscA/HesB family protein [Desulfogranum japonicum]|uniref:IscA/HesB family protein n=1 Tax=Desulfogranum japonicum TaxID=231447 RepID=UPI0004068B43|nr:IscA/HesB family protein [Desulfogranum japonicum]
MFEVSATATEKLTAYLKENNVTSPLRIIVMNGGCSGPALGLALDEQKPGDEVFEQESLTFLMEKELMEQCGDVSIDFIDAGAQSGFHVRSSVPLPGGGGCSSCGSGGCGC